MIHLENGVPVITLDRRDIKLLKVTGVILGVLLTIGACVAIVGNSDTSEDTTTEGVYAVVLSHGKLGKFMSAGKIEGYSSQYGEVTLWPLYEKDNSYWKLNSGATFNTPAGFICYKWDAEVGHFEQCVPQ